MSNYLTLLIAGGYISLVLCKLPDKLIQCSADGPFFSCLSISAIYGRDYQQDFPTIEYPEVDHQYAIFPSHFVQKPQSKREIERRSNGSLYYGFDILVSDKIGPIRSVLPDSRHRLCLQQKYNIDSLGNISVVITHYKEAASVLIRMLNGIIERTPDRLLHEILLIDDWTEKDFSIQQFVEKYGRLVNWTKVKFFKTLKREGLIRARNFGARKASGKVIVFLDSHCEVNEGWIEPLLQRIAENNTRIVSPIIDHINPNSFQYEESVICRGGFDWSLHFQWLYFSPDFYAKQENHVLPFKSPAISGGLFAVDRQFFHHLGALDDGMDIWGGENIELSIRTWLCGGSLEIVPCSRVGHIFRVYRPYSDPKGVNTLERNLARTAKIWLDNYESKYFSSKKENEKLAIGNVEARLVLRERLKCRKFLWFLEHVFPELKVTD